MHLGFENMSVALSLLVAFWHGFEVGKHSFTSYTKQVAESTQ